MDERLREEFALWLSDETWRWTTYGTMTFARPMKKDALRFAKAWVRFIARTAGEVWGFCFQEPHSDGQRLHVHCLLSLRRNLLGEPSNKEMWQWWFRRLGRNLILDYVASIRPSSIQSPNDAAVYDKLASYLTKYVVKEGSRGGFDWDFYAFANGKELDYNEIVKYLPLGKWSGILTEQRSWDSSAR